MRIIIVIGLIAVLFVALLTACQSTPDKPVVIQKDMEQMIEKAQEGDKDSIILKALDAPARYQNDLTNAKGNVIVHIDADVLLPKTDKIPTTKVDKQVFTQETGDKLMEVLLQGQMLYDMEGYVQQTKTEIQQRLVELYAMRDGTMPVSVDGDIEESIKINEREFEKAPEERLKIPAQTIFHKMDVSAGSSDRPLEPYDYIEGVAEIDGAPACFRVQNWIAENRIYAEFYRNINKRYYFNSVDSFIGKFSIDTSELELGITAEEAQAEAEGIIRALGLTEMVCASVELGISLEGSEGAIKGEEIDCAVVPAAYIVHYVRMVAGVPITYTGDTGTNLETEEGYAKPWAYEAINIVIDDNGIVEFIWTSPYTEPEIVTDDTNLLPFGDIQNVFEKMILVEYAYSEDYSCQLVIDNVRLGLARVTNPEQRDSGLLIPVWDFFGGIIAIPDEGEPYMFSQTSKSLLTINAIDGTIIDRGLGY